MKKSITKGQCRTLRTLLTSIKDCADLQLRLEHEVCRVVAGSDIDAWNLAGDVLAEHASNDFRGGAQAALTAIIRELELKVQR